MQVKMHISLSCDKHSVSDWLTFIRTFVCYAYRLTLIGEALLLEF